MNIDNLLVQLGLFWQYPVITEKTFYEQNKGDPNYFPFPWATVIDKRINLQKLLEIFKQIIPMNKNYYTCCQHIRYRELKQFWAALGITTVYTPHKCIGRDKIIGIKLIACPLYAVNIEDESRNEVFKQCDLLKRKRKYFYSFAGGYQPNCYLTDIRLRIFNLNKKKRQDCMIRNTGDWHFNCDVYGGGQDVTGKLNEDERHIIKTKIYNDILLDSRYALAPSGSGPNSIRFWEALGAGSIPVLLADTLELPQHELWKKAIVRVKESELDKLDDILDDISVEEEQERRENCLKLYQYFKHNYRNIDKKMKMVMFTNCHGERYIEMFKRDSDIDKKFDINYIVSYEQLNNFERWKSVFESADVLIINNIKNYNDYTLKNLSKILKKDVLLIVLPFVRFEGYWLPEYYKRLRYFGGNSVSYFPNIDDGDINNYLKNKINNGLLKDHFSKCMIKLKSIENESDIKFYDFFVQNHQEYPMFRDNYHPTMNMLEYIGSEIMKKLNEKFDISYNMKSLKLVKEVEEYGHYKPIQDDIKVHLGLKYDIDKIFIWSRSEYLQKILSYEKRGKFPVKDLDHMRKILE